MEVLEALESYLLDTRQIHPLAGRQAKLFCESVEEPGATHEAHAILLLTLAALNRGSPRPPTDFLLRPIRRAIAERYIQAHVAENGADPRWADSICNEDKVLKTMAGLIDKAIKAPAPYGPIIGTEPHGEGQSWPLLVASGLNGGSLGFSRYWKGAVSLEKSLKELLERKVMQVDPEKAREGLSAVFGEGAALGKGRRYHYRQAAAAALVLRTALLIVSGGPGTGKTTVVIQILRTLLRACDSVQADRIVLCAPTGRAKARLGESIDDGLKAMILRTDGKEPAAEDMALGGLPRKTLHSLLGVRPDGSARFNHGNPLPYQVIVVDEASMVDLHLFAALIDAAPEDARIILVGDMHQLPPVDAGAVLGDLTARFDMRDGFPTLTENTAKEIDELLKGAFLDCEDGYGNSDSLVLAEEGADVAGALADHAVILTNTYRTEARFIVDTAAGVNRGDHDAVAANLSAAEDDAPVVLDTRNDSAPVEEWLKAYYTKERIGTLKALGSLALGTDITPGSVEKKVYEAVDKAFDVLRGARVLTLAHGGPRGRVAINQLADRLLRPTLDAGCRRRYFHGQLVMLDRNLHDLELYNGDAGIVVGTHNSGTRVVFQRGSRYAVHAIERLSGLEPAFAMTVHKAQGSEFDDILIVLPEYDSPLLTRQNLYTGITRAKRSVRILGKSELLKQAIETSEERPGGVNVPNQ